MDNQTAVFVTEIIKGAIGVAFVVATPFAIKTFRAVEEKAKTIIGANNFEYAKDYVKNEYKLHSDLFSEDNVITLLDTLDDKFGDRLSHDTIKKLVDLVLNDIKVPYTTSSAEEARVIKESEVKPTLKITNGNNETAMTLDKSGLTINCNSSNITQTESEIKANVTSSSIVAPVIAENATTPIEQPTPVK